MDPSELSAVSRRPTDSGAAREAAAPWDVQLRPRKALNRCARCLHHGATDQIKDAKHRCLFQTCKCRKCTRYSEHQKDPPAESTFGTQRGAPGRTRGTRGRPRTVTPPPPEDRGSVTTSVSSVQGAGLNKGPGGPAGWSGPRFFVSILDSSSLDEATDNFSFRNFTQGPWPVQHARADSDRASVSASSEWQKKLEAAEALLILRHSAQAPPDDIVLL